MTNDPHSAPQNPNREHDEHRANDFIVPEPDGVESGVPFANSDQQAQRHPEQPASTPRQPLATATPSLRFKALSGTSLKRKLNLAVGLLTAVILVLGIVSFTTLREVSIHAIEELARHAELSHLSEEIKTTLYQIQEAERRFLAGGDRSALAHVERLMAKIEARVKEIGEVAKNIESTAGVPLDQQFVALLGNLDSFQVALTARVAKIDTARAALEQHQNAELKAAEQLRDSADALIEQSGASLNSVRGFDDNESTGGLLSSVHGELMALRIELGDYLAAPVVGRAERLSASLTELRTRLDLEQSRAGSGDRPAIARLRKEFSGFAGDLRGLMDQHKATRTAETELASLIDGHEEQLQQLGKEIIGDAETLASGAWNDIEHETEEISKMGANARLMVGLTAVIGSIVGLIVLFTVPPPIINSIEQLLGGAQRIARGNLTTPVEVDSRDELGQLADSFNHMRENLLSLVQRIQRSAVQLSSSINEIQAAATEQAASASQQASAVNELSASLNEMSQSAATLVGSSETVGRNVDEIATIVTDSNQNASQMMESMDAIGGSTRQTAERIKSLNDKMDDINEAVSTISMVADQTTLLSLNASIEANKAGEMGKGFSVVAQEIRRLSDRSIDSAGNISSMVRDIQRATESSALAMDKSSEEIRHGVNRVKTSADSLGSIHDAMERIQEQMKMILESVRAQADSSRMVQTTSTEMLSSSNMVAKAASQTRSVTYELNAMATQLSSAVAAFKV